MKMKLKIDNGYIVVCNYYFKIVRRNPMCGYRIINRIRGLFNKRKIIDEIDQYSHIKYDIASSSKCKYLPGLHYYKSQIVPFSDLKTGVYGIHANEDTIYMNESEKQKYFKWRRYATKRMH